MFNDPAVVTVNAVAKNLVRINQDTYSSEYMLRTATDEFKLNIRNTSRTDKSKKLRVDRHNVELTQTVYPVAPSTRSYFRKAYLVFENEEGDTLTDPQYIVGALCAFMSNANIQRLINQES
jgi:hypothetical protein